MTAVRLTLRSGLVLTLASLAGLMMLCWPLLVHGGSTVQPPFLFLLLLPVIVAVVLAELGEGGLDPRVLAVLGVLSAVNAVLRGISAGTAGVELVFFLLVLAGRVFGPGFGFVLGCTSLFASAAAWTAVSILPSIAAISRSSPESSSATPPSIASTISPIRSTIPSTALTSAASGTRSPARTADSASSAAWLSLARRGRSRKPQLPLTVCTNRKIASSRARSDGSASQAMISPDNASIVSRVSAMNSCSRSSMVPRGAFRAEPWAQSG